jgi:hypothetical protein
MIHQRQMDASKAATCIRGAQRQMELPELMEPDMSTKHWRQSKQSELVGTGWDLSRVTSAACRI